jgi:hypothetical protein
MSQQSTESIIRAIGSVKSRSPLPNKDLQQAMNSAFQSIRGSILAAGVSALALAVSAL